MYEITTASRQKPSWWTNLPLLNTQETDILGGLTTIKACPAVHSLFNIGYVIKSPVDFEIVSEQDQYYLHLSPELGGENSPYSRSIFYGHPLPQFPTFHEAAPDYHDRTLKVDTQINVVSDAPVNLMLLNPYWGFNRNLVMMDSILQVSGDSYDKLGHAIIPNFLVRKNTRTVVKRGEPLIHVIPFAQQNVSAELTTLFDRQDSEFFTSLESRMNDKGVFSRSLITRTPLKQFIFKNVYRLKRIDPKVFLKRVRRSKQFPFFSQLAKRSK